MEKQVARIPHTMKKRVVIVGGGFAGLRLARKLSATYFQVVLIDRNNYHQFQPLYYQVATSGLEPSSISFPLRKIFQNHENVHFRTANLDRVDQEHGRIDTTIGTLGYDYLVIACGTDTNFFGNENIRKYAKPMKSTAEAIHVRNVILENYEKALSATTDLEESALMNIVVAGGGPTGVELAGSLAEMRRFVLPKDYPELDFSLMRVMILEGGNRLLGGMSEQAGDRARGFLQKMGVEVSLNALVQDYDGREVVLKDGRKIKTRTLLWAAGVKGNIIPGLDPNVVEKGNRIRVNEFSQISSPGWENVFVVGDLALMKGDPQFPDGHPQVAQPALQQASQLAENLRRKEKEKEMKPFRYIDKGSLATIGRNKAVADLPFGKFSGYLAWLLWLVIHLMALVGKKNRLFVFMNWMISYWSYDQSLRLLIKPVDKT